MRALIRFSTILFLMLASLTTAAAIQRPDVMLDNVTQEMLKALRNEHISPDANGNRVVGIINRVLVPHVDSVSMAKWVVGRNGWFRATPSQRDNFTREFKDLVIRTYAASLAAYNNQTIEYTAVKEDYTTKQRIIVSSVIREPGRDPISVAYRLVKQGDKWKVYDINIEGVSLLQGFKSQFAEDIQRNGIDSVINKIKKHNQKPIS